jgi:predicted Zn finger-like uncharacterized protein
MIDFTCPSCDTVFEVPREMAGARGPCSRCGQQLEIPDPPETTLVELPEVGHSNRAYVGLLAFLSP